MIAPKDEEEMDMTDEEVVEEEESSERLQDGQTVICGGMIVEKKKLTSKKSNKDMAFIKIEDIYGNIEVAVMPNVYPKFKNLLEEDNMITIKGKISFRNEIPSVMAEDIIPWNKKEESVEEVIDSRKLYIRCDTKNFDEFEKIKNILGTYHGSHDVIIKCTSTGKAFAYSIKVDINNYLLNELYGALGEQNVIVK